MKINSLVVPTIDYKMALEKNPHLTFNGIIPNTDTICVVKEIYDNDGEMCLKLEESTCYYVDLECGFLKKYWREIQENVPLSALIEEIEESIQVTI